MVHNILNYHIRTNFTQAWRFNSARKMSKMANTLNVRWAMNTKDWIPTLDQILTASTLIQPEEKDRISKFIYKDDAKSSLLGRLLLRKFAHLSTSIPYEEIRFGRDEHGKPILMGSGDIPVTFNISHQGEYVVLAGDTRGKIGIDVMNIEPTPHKNIPQFFKLMNKQFSQQEWDMVRSFPTDKEQLACFYRLWSLKESYVKNIGVGITVALNKISFSIKTVEFNVGDIITDSFLHEDGVLKDDWLFEETLLDEKHIVSVASHIKKDADYVPVPFSFLTFDELIKEAKPLCARDTYFTDQFMSKDTKEERKKHSYHIDYQNYKSPA